MIFSLLIGICALVVGTFPRFKSLLVLHSIELLVAEGTQEARKNVPHVRTYFYVGGSYGLGVDGTASIWEGQMYVERLSPPTVTKRYPLVMMHGNGMFLHYRSLLPSSNH